MPHSTIRSWGRALAAAAALGGLLVAPEAGAAEGGWADQILIDPASSALLFVWLDGEQPISQRVSFRDIVALQRALPYEAQVEELLIETVDGQRLLVSLGQKSGGHAALLSGVLGTSPALIPGASARHTAPPHADDDAGPRLVLGDINGPLAARALSTAHVADAGAEALGSLLGESPTAEVTLDAPAGFLKSTDGRGELERNAIELGVQSRMPTFRNCYQRQVQRTPNLKGGRVTIQFVIDEDGIVDRARVQATSLHNSAVEQCIVQNLQGAQFARPQNGTVVVSYPFSFTRN